MYKILLRFKNDGECFNTGHYPVNHSLGVNEELLDSSDFRTSIYHKEPFKSKYRYSKIKEKQKEIISDYSYIQGLSVGHQQDTAWKNWIESVIVFHTQYENTEINADLIEFPEDPLGNKEVVDFR